jgi:uncharacterized protein GlcG (DUF336 family)
MKLRSAGISGVFLLGAAVTLGSVSSATAATLTPGEANRIFQACQNTASKVPSKFGRKHGTKMWCAVLSREGETLITKATDTGESPGSHLQTDAWRASIEIAEAKAYTALSVSSNDLALDSKTVGLATRTDVCLSSPCGAPGTDTGPAPLWGLGNTNPFRFGSGSNALFPDDSPGFKHHGIVTFAGGQPVYSCRTHELLGGVGVSGDGVDEDDAVAKGAVTGAGFGLKPDGTGCPH